MKILVDIIEKNGGINLGIDMPCSKNATALAVYYLANITPEIAAEIQNNSTSTIQRTYAAEREEHHLRNIIEGKFRACAISIAMFPDKTYSIIDGQHRIAALANSVYDNIAIMFDVYQVNTEDDAAAIFSTYDHLASTKKLKDSVGAYGLSEMYGLTSAVIETYHNSVLLSKSQSECKSIDKLDKTDIEALRKNVANNIEFIDLIEKFKKVCKKKTLIGKLMEKPLGNTKGLVVLLHLYNENPVKLEEFFIELELLTNMDESGTPLHRLYKFIQDSDAYTKALWTKATPTILRSYIWLIWEGIFHKGIDGKQGGNKLSLELLMLLKESKFKFHGTDLAINIK